MHSEKIARIVEYIQSQTDRLRTERKLFSIYEGGLIPYVDEILHKQLGKRAATEALERTPPINILSKLVTKLSSLYVDPPERIPDSKADSDLLKKYLKSMKLDSYMYDANIFFNLHKRVALEPYIKNGKPKIRVIPAHNFLVYSDDREDPTNPTVFIKFVGTEGKLDLYHLYTDTEFVAITSEGDVYKPDMVNNPEGINPYGKIPFVYINASRYNLLPEPDDELLRMTLLVPVLYSDINFGAKYQVFSIIYGIDVNTENLEVGPNQIWQFNSSDEAKKPHIGTIKPEIDMEQMTQNVTNQLATFFETRNLRGATIAGFAGGRYGQQDSGGQSGVAILIQNLDTTEIRKAHSKIFEESENLLWELITDYMHPEWLRNNEFAGKETFTQDSIETKFSPEYEIKSDMDLVNEIKAKLGSGLISRKMALEQLYPNKTEAELKQLSLEITSDNLLSIGIEEVDNESGKGSREGDQEEVQES